MARGHFRVGDTLQVEHRPSLSEKVERSVGLCIGRHRRGLGSSFRLLCKPDGVAVEYQFFLYSPLLTSIEVRAKPRKRYRKSKLYYMRERVNEISFPKPIRRDDKGEVVVPKGKEEEGPLGAESTHLPPRLGHPAQHPHQHLFQPPRAVGERAVVGEQQRQCARSGRGGSSTASRSFAQWRTTNLPASPSARSAAAAAAARRGR